MDDANGSCTEKATYDDKGTPTTADDELIEQVTNGYNLAGQLSRVVTDYDAASSTNSVDVADYTYDDAGIRVRKYAFSVAQNYLGTVDEQANATDKQTTAYLVDSYNHTGYAQTLEELTYNKANPVVGTDIPDSVCTYLIGDDVIAQTADGVTDYLLYDGKRNSYHAT